MTKILVVEDEPLIALALAADLETAGFQVLGPVGTADGARALIAREGCDGAVLDVNLHGESSESVADALSARGTPFVSLSGYSREQRPPAFKGSPSLLKPVQTELLISVLRKSLYI